MADPFRFQNATAYNAASLVGEQFSTSNYPGMIVYFVPTGSYDGTVTFQFSPNGGTTWYALPLYDVTSAIGTAVYSIASPTAAKAYLTSLPTNAIVRLLMAGGGQGALTAYGLPTSYAKA